MNGLNGMIILNVIAVVLNITALQAGDSMFPDWLHIVCASLSGFVVVSMMGVKQ